MEPQIRGGGEAWERRSEIKAPEQWMELVLVQVSDAPWSYLCSYWKAYQLTGCCLVSSDIRTSLFSGLDFMDSMVSLSLSLSLSLPKLCESLRPTLLGASAVRPKHARVRTQKIATVIGNGPGTRQVTVQLGRAAKPDTSNGLRQIRGSS